MYPATSPMSICMAPQLSPVVAPPGQCFPAPFPTHINDQMQFTAQTALMPRVSQFSGVNDIGPGYAKSLSHANPDHTSSSTRMFSSLTAPTELRHQSSEGGRSTAHGQLEMPWEILNRELLEILVQNSNRQYPTSVHSELIMYCAHKMQKSFDAGTLSAAASISSKMECYVTERVEAVQVAMDEQKNTTLKQIVKNRDIRLRKLERQLRDMEKQIKLKDDKIHSLVTTSCTCEESTRSTSVDHGDVSDDVQASAPRHS
eukprot:Nk52_evm14s1892 gene=Nk52_evmTU14s1892